MGLDQVKIDNRMEAGVPGDVCMYVYIYIWVMQGLRETPIRFLSLGDPLLYTAYHYSGSFVYVPHSQPSKCKL